MRYPQYERQETRSVYCPTCCTRRVLTQWSTILMEDPYCGDERCRAAFVAKYRAAKAALGAIADRGDIEYARRWAAYLEEDGALLVEALPQHEGATR